MTSAHDVARAILDRNGATSLPKLQRLLYYSQAWSLAWDGEPLFPESIRAWSDGPTVRALFETTRGRFALSPGDLDGDGVVPAKGIATVEAVLAAYGGFDGLSLGVLARSEPPWRDARGEDEPTAMSDRPIPHEAMRAYYGSL